MSGCVGCGAPDDQGCYEGCSETQTTALVPEIVAPGDGTMSLAELESKGTALAKIVTPQQAQDAGYYLRVVRQSLRTIKADYAAKRKKLKDSIKADLKQLDEDEERRRRPFSLAETQVDTALTAWRVADRQRVEAENKAALERARADEQVKREATVAAMTAQAEKAKGIDKTILKAQAKALALAPLTPTVSVPLAEETKIAGVALIEYHSAVVDDLMVLVQAVAMGRVPLAAIQPGQAFLDSKAEEYGPELNYPGVRVVKDYGQTARGL